MSTRHFAILAASVGVLLLTGCATAVEPTTETGPVTAAIPESGMSEEQTRALEDGTVTFDEYQASFDRFVACAAQSNITISVDGEENRVIEYHVGAAESDSEAYLGCYVTEFQQVDESWQLSREDSSALSQELATCLERWGLDVPPRFADRVAALDAAGIDPVQCEKL